MLKEKVMKRPRPSGLKSSQRARRFEIKVPIRYRETSKADWHDGRIENISQSGVLFRAPEPLSPDTLIDLNFALPNGKEGETGATVICDGRTIRTILPATSDESPGVAVKILNYKLERSE